MFSLSFSSSSRSFSAKAFVLLLLLLASFASGNGGGGGAYCRTGTLSCGSDSDCWNKGNGGVGVGNGVGGKSGGTNSTKSGQVGVGGAGISSPPHNCKCCRGYPFHPQGECRSDCRINPDLYLAQLHGRLAFNMCNGGQQNGAKNGFLTNGYKK